MQLCASAHLGCSCAVGTSEWSIKSKNEYLQSDDARKLEILRHIPLLRTYTNWLYLEELSEIVNEEKQIKIMNQKLREKMSYSIKSPTSEDQSLDENNSIATNLRNLTENKNFDEKDSKQLIPGENIEFDPMETTKK